MIATLRENSKEGVSVSNSPSTSNQNRATGRWCAAFDPGLKKKLSILRWTIQNSFGVE